MYFFWDIGGALKISPKMPPLLFWGQHTPLLEIKKATCKEINTDQYLIIKKLKKKKKAVTRFSGKAREIEIEWLQIKSNHFVTAKAWIVSCWVLIHRIEH